MLLNKRERNQFYEAIIKAKLEPAEFDLKDTNNKVIITNRSGSTFKFTRRIVKRIAEAVVYEYDVTARVTEGRTLIDSVIDVESLLAVYFPVWLNEIRLTIRAPDYWEEMKRRRQSLAKIQREPGNAPFTPDEQRQIAAWMAEITKQVKEQFELTTEQMERIEEKLDEAAEASKRISRKDWLMCFMGTISSLVITATVPVAVGDHIFSIAIQGIGHLFTGAGAPLQILS